MKHNRLSHFFVKKMFFPFPFLSFPFLSFPFLSVVVGIAANVTVDMQAPLLLRVTRDESVNVIKTAIQMLLNSPAIIDALLETCVAFELLSISATVDSIG
jgi:hypothetical protein